MDYNSEIKNVIFKNQLNSTYQWHWHFDDFLNINYLRISTNKVSNEEKSYFLSPIYNIKAPFIFLVFHIIFKNNNNNNNKPLNVYYKNTIGGEFKYKNK